MRRQAEVITDIPLSATHPREIDCQDNSTVASRLGTLHQHLRALEASIGIKLKPEWAAGSLGNLLKAAVRGCTGHHQGASRTCCLSSRALTFGIRETMVCCRRYEQRHTYCNTQYS